ncbi:MAG: SUMF1/EgtB/PvdO family nonheme iron enzyme [Pirellulaceae bacterium]|nr:SUMF1/EgtB/PvdO family nonheme iron enzyme [Pirellulaceae bacterium]MDP7018544.1 SUMF1/EgtB/PvdO family nonheme iron enzyme [Pirellulaceae bacterium]
MSRNDALRWAVAVFCIAGAVEAEEQPIRFAATRPQQGPSVPTMRGFMIPYSVEVPGAGAMEMIPVPGGWLTVGSTQPPTRIRIEPFWMAKYEVTWAEYVEYVELYPLFRDLQRRGDGRGAGIANVDAVTAPTAIYDPNYRMEFATSARQPATSMTQYAARQYSKWLSLLVGEPMRLPTLAEWQYACRAGTRGPWSCDERMLADHGVFQADVKTRPGPRPVGSKAPNPWGLHDMHGNVAEWVIDAAAPSGWSRLTAGDHSTAAAIFLPRSRYGHLVCGGGWGDGPRDCQTTSTRSSTADWWDQDANFPQSPWWLAGDNASEVGFRLVRPLRDHSAAEMSRYWDADSKQLKGDIQMRLDEGRGVVGRVDRELPELMRRDRTGRDPSWARPWLRPRKAQK